jgi:hypothetical protein
MIVNKMSMPIWAKPAPIRASLAERLPCALVAA